MNSKIETTETSMSGPAKSSLGVGHTVVATSPACPPNTYVIGGGAHIAQGSNILVVANSEASGSLLGGTWKVTAVTVKGAHKNPGTIKAFAICAN